MQDCEINIPCEIKQEENAARLFDKMAGWRNIETGKLGNVLDGAKIHTVLPFQDVGILLIVEAKDGELYAVDLFGDVPDIMIKAQTRRYEGISRKKWEALRALPEERNDCQHFHAQILPFKKE